MKLLTDNIKWIVLATVIVGLTNYLTMTHYDGLSKKEKKILQDSLVYLDKKYLEESIIQLANYQKLKKLHAEDSIMLEQSKELMFKDQALIVKQQETLKKYKKLNSHQILLKLDSAYEANTH